MKVVILAGGLGTRLSEKTYKIPKPLIEIGNIPILIHIMKIYSYYGFNDFIICLGYKGYLIKKYFLHYCLYNSYMTIDFKSNEFKYHNNLSENWKVTLVDTGLNTFTAGRILKIKEYIDEDTFMLTYGDGVSNININELLHFHTDHKKIATCTAVQQASRFGKVKINEENFISDFNEKPINDNSWINGGFFVFNKEIFNYLDDDMLEKNVLPKLVEDKQLKAYKHKGFWKCMDTMSDKSQLEKMWIDNPKWKLDKKG